MSALARRLSPLSLYAAAIGVLGLSALALVGVLDNPFAALARNPLYLGALGLALVASETKAIPLPRGDGTVARLTISTIFAMALVLLGPLSFVLAAHTVAVAVDDLRSRSRPLQVVFNAGQYCLALLAARWTWCALTGTPVLRGFTPFHGSG